VPKVYYWTRNGGAVNMSFFDPGQPDNCGGNSTYIVEGFLEIGWYTQQMLNDAPNTWLLNYACEYDN